MATVTEQIRGMCDPTSFIQRRLTVEQYHQMIETGIITEDDDVELLEGYLVPTDGHSPSHDGPIMVLQRSLQVLLPPDGSIRVQMPITLDVSEPEPDIAVVRGPDRLYFQRHPWPADIGQLVEVSDTTLAKDRHKGVKLKRMAVPFGGP
jgi:hypothetical protein